MHSGSQNQTAAGHHSTPVAWLCRDLQEQFELTNNRNMPDWGREIFSDQCVLMMPKSGRDVEAFVTYVIGLVHQHLRLAWHIKPLDGPDR